MGAPLMVEDARVQPLVADNRAVPDPGRDRAGHRADVGAGGDAMGLALRGLATDAAKHGALPEPEGVTGSRRA